MSTETQEPDHGFRPSLLAGEEPAAAGSAEQWRILSTVQGGKAPARRGRRSRHGARARWPGWVFGGVALTAAGAMLWGLWQAAARPAPTLHGVAAASAASASARGSASASAPDAVAARSVMRPAAAHPPDGPPAQAGAQAGAADTAQAAVAGAAVPTDGAAAVAAPAPAPFAALDRAPAADAAALGEAARAATASPTPTSVSTVPARPVPQERARPAAAGEPRRTADASRGRAAAQPARGAERHAERPAARPPVRKVDPDVELLEAVMRHSPKLPAPARAASAPSGAAAR